MGTKGDIKALRHPGVCSEAQKALIEIGAPAVHLLIKTLRVRDISIAATEADPMFVDNNFDGVQEDPTSLVTQFSNFDLTIQNLYIQNAGSSITYVADLFGATPSYPTLAPTFPPTLTSTPTPTPPTDTPLPFPGLSWWEAEQGYISPFTVGSSGSYSYLYQSAETSLETGGRASYIFEVPESEDYLVKAIANTLTTGSNSFFLNIDAEPQSPGMVWDIVNLTNGFQERIVSWRGNGTYNKNEFDPKVFSFSTGTHEQILMRKRAYTHIDKLKLELISSTPPSFTGVSNGDGEVDGVDYVIWLNHFGSSTSSGPSHGDFNNSGFVDGVDNVIWFNIYGG